MPGPKANRETTWWVLEHQSCP